jgi:hypothetical protein
MADTRIKSVLYCRARGSSAYPFLIIHLKHATHPVVPKLQGFDGPLTLQKDDPWDTSDTSDECSTFTVARVGQSIREVVGTWCYDVCYTMKCRRGGIPDILMLAELSTERDGSRAVYPTALFLALETLCNGTVTRSTKCHAGAARCYSDIADALANDAASAVIFPARQQQMKEQIDLWSGFGHTVFNE